VVRDIGAGEVNARKAVRQDARTPSRPGCQVENAFAGLRLKSFDGMFDGVGNASANVVVTTCG
jgi:hypothetical protein